MICRSLRPPPRAARLNSQAEQLCDRAAVFDQLIVVRAILEQARLEDTGRERLRQAQRSIDELRRLMQVA